MASGKKQSFIEQARRVQIVAAAIDTIAEVGFADATYARIAERAGISPALISYHFGSKTDLIAAVIEHITEDLEASIVAATEGVESFTEALRGLIEAHVGYTGSNSAKAIALKHIYSGGAIWKGVGPSAEERRGWIDEIASMIEEGQREGEFAAFDPRPMAVTLIAALEAAPTELRMRPDADPAAYASELADLFEAAATRRPQR